MDFTIISAVGFPIFLAVGGILAWKASRKQRQFDEPETKATTWRDDSLDDWRRERDAQLEREREQREVEREERLRTGQEEQQETTRRTHTRLGG